MVKDFINNKNGTNVRLAFLSFRNFSASSNYLDREQINELSTIDSLIGVVFKSYWKGQMGKHNGIYPK
jgi:hypothetical protein